MELNPVKLIQLLEQDLGEQSDVVRNFKKEALLKSILKKYIPPDYDESSLKEAAFARFFATNDRVKAWLPSTSFLTSPLVHLWRHKLHRALEGPEQEPRVTLSGALDYGRTGPGSSVGTPETSLLQKMFSGPLTATSDYLFGHYTFNCCYGRWREAEATRSALYGETIVPGSKLGTAAKTRDELRTTCSEPILNMFYQLGIKDQFETVLRDRFNINLEDQPVKNRSLARLGSINNKISTVDLKEASDSTAVALCHLLLPRHTMRALLRSRSECVYHKGKSIDLGMIGTMGNGFTFALMTLIFVALVHAIYELHDVKPTSANCGVFGDDIIIESEYVKELIDALNSAGYIVNEAKSFTEGPFRESCGGDYYLGHDVRGVYIKEFSHETHCYSAFNRLHLWALRHNFSIPATLNYLRGMVDFLPSPCDCGVSAGFIVSSLELASPKYDRKTGGTRYRAWANKPAYYGRMGERCGGIPDGAEIAFIGGYIRGDQMAVRINQPRRRVVEGNTSSWDWYPYPWLTTIDLHISWRALLGTL